MQLNIHTSEFSSICYSKFIKKWLRSPSTEFTNDAWPVFPSGDLYDYRYVNYDSYGRILRSPTTGSSDTVWLVIPSGRVSALSGSNVDGSYGHVYFRRAHMVTIGPFFVNSSGDNDNDYGIDVNYSYGRI